MFRDLKLSQKAVILVAIPLCFELIFIGILLGTLLEVKSALRQSEQSQKVLSIIELLGGKSMISAGVLLSGYSVTRNIAWIDGYLNILERCRHQISELEAATASNPEHSVIMPRIKKYGASTLALAIEVRGMLSRNSLLIPTSMIRDRMKTLQSAGMADLSALARYEENHHKDLAERQELLQGKIKVVLACGFGISVLLAGALALFFNKTTSARLSILITHARQLAEQGALIERLPGNDELSKLDRAFHDLADKLKEIDDFEQDVLSMVSHDLRGPLASIRLSLLVLTEGVRGPLPEKTLKDLSFALNSVDRLFSLITLILDVRRFESGKLALVTEIVSLPKLLEECISTAKLQSSGLKVDYIHPLKEGHDVTCEGDVHRLREALSYLLARVSQTALPDSSVQVSLIPEHGALDLRITYVSSVMAYLPNEADRGSITSDDTDICASFELAIAKAIFEAHSGKFEITSLDSGHQEIFASLPSEAIVRSQS